MKPAGASSQKSHFIEAVKENPFFVIPEVVIGNPLL